MANALRPLHPADQRTPARGVVYLHACPRAYSPHVEWALTELLGQEVSIDWTDQPVSMGSVRGEYSWQAEPGTAAAIASDLMNAFTQLRFEVTEEPTPGREGERYAVTPALGLFRATIGIHGDIMISEERLRAAMQESADAAEFQERVDTLLGAAWDRELETFRYAGDGAPVRWLHHVG